MNPRGTWPAMIFFGAILAVLAWTVRQGPSPKPLPPPPPPQPTAALCNQPRVEGDAHTEIAMLLDTSISFRRAGSYQRAVDRIKQLSTQMDELQHPLRLRVLPLGTYSHNVACNIYVPDVNIFGLVCKQDSMSNQMIGCLRTLAQLPDDKYTNISGALNRASAELGKPSGDDLHIIMVLSDFDESLPPRTPALTADLTSTCIVNVYEGKLPQDPGLSERVALWEQRERDWHGMPSSQPLPGVKFNQIMKFLKRCTTDGATRKPAQQQYSAD